MRDFERDCGCNDHIQMAVEAANRRGTSRRRWFAAALFAAALGVWLWTR